MIKISKKLFGILSGIIYRDTNKKEDLIDNNPVDK